MKGELLEKLRKLSGEGEPSAEMAALVVPEMLAYMEGPLGDFTQYALFLCESPIERLFLAGFFARVPDSFDEVSVLGGKKSVCEYTARFNSPMPFNSKLKVEAQAMVGEYRVDFLFTCTLHGVPDFDNEVEVSGQRIPGRKDLTRTLIVECDGHDFHEKTKEQAAHDKARDRILQSTGHCVFRFTGSEIWKSPDKCANDTIEFLTKW